ncbi:5'-3' exonuclease [Williamsia sterculiae]|nr:5'-3' exonuclease [Williamsia sterculiae]
MLLDGASLWFRAFHALPEKMTAPDGRPVNAVRGFLDMIAALVTRERPCRLVVCLDIDWRPAFRTALIPSYKAHRVDEEDTSGLVEEVPDTLGPQVDMIADVLAAAGIACAGADDCEADDVIGTLAFAETADPVVVVSGDRDLLQVAADDPVSVRVLYVGRGLAKAELYGPDEIADRYGVPARHAGSAYAELAILRGDPSDGLPGVTGVGEKTGARLITEFGDLDGVEHAARDGNASISPRIRTSILDSADYLRAARTVVFVRTDADVEGRTDHGWVTRRDWDSADDALPTGPADKTELDRLAEELAIGSSIGRLATALGWSGADRAQ